MAFNAESLMRLGLSWQLAQEILLNVVGDVQLKAHATSNGTLAAGVATGTSQCVVSCTATGANAVTLRTAAQMFADIPSCVAGFTFQLSVIAAGNGTVTLTAPDANTTITGSATIAAGTVRNYIVVFNTATTMTITNVSGSLGADVTTVGTTQLFPLGARTTAANGNVFIYGQVGASNQNVAQFDFVTVDNAGTIASLMAADVKLGKQIGVSQVAIAASSFGWVCISGIGLLGNVTANAQNNAPVIPSISTGRIDTTAGVAAGVTSILGISLPLTAGLTSTAIGVSLTSPVLKL